MTGQIDVIALENKADGVVSVGIPITILKRLCGFSVDDQITLRISVETADDIEHRCLSASRGTEKTDKLAIGDLEGKVIYRDYLFIDLFVSSGKDLG